MLRCFPNAIGEYSKPRRTSHLNVSVDDLIFVQVFEPLEDLFGVEDDGGLVVFQRTPFGAQEGRQTSYEQGHQNDICGYMSHWKNTIQLFPNRVSATSDPALERLLTYLQVFI